MIFLATIVDRAREAMGTPSDCTAPSTSHNRGASTGHRCRGKVAFRRLRDVSPMVPPPSAWAASGVPMLREAIEFIEMLVNDSAGFKERPRR